jgi:hypothetical protein
MGQFRQNSKSEEPCLQDPHTANNRPLLPLLLMGIGIGLLLVVAFVLIRQNQVTQERLSEPFPVVPTAAEESTYPEIPRVSLTDAKAAFDKGNAIFVDVRDPTSYASGHVKGAINLPLTDLSNRLSELDKAAWIITYCT